MKKLSTPIVCYVIKVHANLLNVQKFLLCMQTLMRNVQSFHHIHIIVYHVHTCTCTLTVCHVHVHVPVVKK